MTPEKTTSMPLEVAVFSSESLIKAQNQGASRVELNAVGSYALGGTTPPVSELAKVSDQVRIPVRIMIRPRGPPSDGSQDFLYTNAEIQTMIASIKEFRATGLMNPFRGDGFVFGVLSPSNAVDPITNEPERIRINTVACSALREAARPFGCVFHRAFDPIAATKRISEGIETLVALGFEGLLTAGGNGNCQENIDRIDHECHKQAGKIQFVLGGGLRFHNVQTIAERFSFYEKGSVWMHTAALSPRPDYPVEEIDSNELVKMVAALKSVTVT